MVTLEWHNLIDTRGHHKPGNSSVTQMWLSFPLSSQDTW